VVFVISFAAAPLWRESQSLLFQLYRHTHASLIGIPWGTLLYDGLVLLSWSLLYYGINDWIEIEQQRERAARAEAMLQQARLHALQSQLEPHFLFNTLNAISTLVSEGENSDAVRMIARVSDFLRLTLDSVGTVEIQVAEELEFVRRYLEIEQVRFGDRLRVTINAEPETLSAMVPALVLQPLVENAVKHGIQPRENGGCVTLKIAREDATLFMTVTDDGAGLSAASDLTRGVGMMNTAARLEELYGSKSHFSVKPSPKGGAIASVEIPFRTTSLSPGKAEKPK
jgi:LytS/YehU family sensor histidine kinase